MLSPGSKHFELHIDLILFKRKFLFFGRKIQDFMKKVLDGKWEVPWSISLETPSIKGMMEKGNITVKHVYREANQWADYLTNLIVHFAGNFSYHSVQDIPAEGRKIFDMDISQVASIRIKKCQNNNFWSSRHGREQLGLKSSKKNHSFQFQVH